MELRQFEAARVYKRMADALASIQLNADQGELAAQGGTLKRLIADGYDLQAGVSADVFWNWGLFREDLHRELSRQIPEYDKYGSDGHSEQLYLYTLKEVPADQDRARKILEVGCGTGMGLNLLSRLEGRSTFVGLDLSQQAVDIANARFSRPGSLTYVQGDAESLPFADGEFDVIINVESSHNYPNLRGFFLEAARVLRPGGFFSHVDMFTDNRHALLEKCKLQTSGELDWIKETDISEYVRGSIRRRMVPGSKMRRHQARLLPFPLGHVLGSVMMRAYGSDFLVDHTSSSGGRRSRWFDSPGWQWAAQITSYRHTLATKSRGEVP